MEYLQDIGNMDMGEMEQKAETLLEMIESGRLSISDVRLDK